MMHGERVKWTSHTGRERTGAFVAKMQSKPGFVLVKGDDGKVHVMRQNKPQVIKSREKSDAVVG